jgi:hypothetical protein
VEDRREARFPIGRLLITPGALEVLTPAEVQAALSRHVRGDWGDVDAADRISNTMRSKLDSACFRSIAPALPLSDHHRGHARGNDHLVPADY